MKQLFFAVALLAAGSIVAERPASASAVDGNPTAFITSLGNAVVEILEDPALSQDERVKRYVAQFRAAFDWDRIGVFAIGRYRQGLTHEKFAEYRDLFAQHMTKIYAARFADYSGERFVVKGERPVGRDGSEVFAEIRGAGSQEAVGLAFKVVDDGGNLKIYDVSINGVSLLVAKRAEVKGILASRGIDGLIATLRRAAN